MGEAKRKARRHNARTWATGAIRGFANDVECAAVNDELRATMMAAIEKTKMSVTGTVVKLRRKRES
jgi:hypothetical protein